MCTHTVLMFPESTREAELVNRDIKCHASLLIDDPGVVQHFLQDTMLGREQIRNGQENVLFVYVTDMPATSSDLPDLGPSFLPSL